MADRNIDELIGRIKETVDNHRLEKEGDYARWLWQDKAGGRNLGINEYGCADAANILYTINEFIVDPQKRACWINSLKNLQNVETGLFSEPTHHFIHTTAHCIAALELFDARPDHPLRGLIEYSTKEGLLRLLNGLDWANNPWPQSHQGAGIYVALVLTETVGPEWVESYSKWLWEESDPVTGMWRANCVNGGKAPLYHHMGGSFHYLFNHEYAKMPLRYPERLIDSCISLYTDHQIGNNFGAFVGFLEIDWVYCLNRASRQTPHRFHECKTIIRKFASDYIDYLYSIKAQEDDGFNDLHMLFGAICALAELQQALPGEITTKKPLRLVLDRRPFI